MKEKLLVLGILYHDIPKYNKQNFLNEIVAYGSGIFPEIYCYHMGKGFNQKTKNELEKLKEQYPRVFHYDHMNLKKYKYNNKFLNYLTEDYSKYQIQRGLKANFNSEYDINIKQKELLEDVYRLNEYIEENDINNLIAFGSGTTIRIAHEIVKKRGGKSVIIEQGYFRNYGVQTSNLDVNFAGNIIDDYLNKDFKVNKLDVINFKKYRYYKRKEKYKEEEKITFDINGNKIDLNDEYIFVPLQINVDSAISLYSKTYQNMKSFVKDVKKFIALYNEENNKNIKCIFKVHPWHMFQDDADDFPFISSQLNEENIFFVEHECVSKLITFSKAVVTINSTVGFEALNQKKKVLIFGDCIYALDKLVYVGSNKYSFDEKYELFKKMLNDPQGIDIKELNKYMTYILKYKHIKMKDHQNPKPEEIKGLFKELKRDNNTYLLINADQYYKTQKKYMNIIVGIETKSIKINDQIVPISLENPNIILDKNKYVIKDLKINKSQKYFLKIDGEYKIEFFNNKSNSKNNYLFREGVHYNYNAKDNEKLIVSFSIFDEREHLEPNELNFFTNSYYDFSNDLIKNKDIIIKIILEYQKEYNIKNEDVTFKGDKLEGYVSLYYSKYFTNANTMVNNPILDPIKFFENETHRTLYKYFSKNQNVPKITTHSLYNHGEIKLDKNSDDYSSISLDKYLHSNNLNFKDDENSIFKKQSKGHICFIVGEYTFWIKDGKRINLDCGGIAVFVETFSKTLIENGYTVTIIGSIAAVDKQTMFTDYRRNFIFIPSRDRYSNVVKKINNILYFVNKNNKIDIVETTDSKPFVQTISTSWLNIMRFHISLELISTFLENKKLEDMNMEREIENIKSYKYIDSFVGVSNWVATETQKLFSLDERKIYGHIYNFVEIDKHIKPSIEVKNRKKLFFHGTKNALKNIQNLVKVFEEIVKLDPEFELYLIGRNNEYYEKECKKYQKVSLKNTFVSSEMPQEDLKNILKGLGTYISFSQMEACSLAVLDAFALAKPTILSSRLPVFAEMANEEAAIFVDYTNPKLAAKTIVDDIKDEKKYIKRANASIKLSNFYSKDKKINENLTYYEYLLKNKDKIISDRDYSLFNDDITNI